MHASAPSLEHATLPVEGFLGSVFTGLARSVDDAVVRGVQWVVERALIPDPANLGALRESAAPLLDAALQADPRRFFDFGAETS
ncbi:MAG TPA: hypothetical protein VJP77_01765, partial [Planctomycetota bacterium]|nr:hypothetical protein [Planctomycetota bacterium]